jgi:4'-phosphopantetheinyl transferase
MIPDYTRQADWIDVSCAFPDAIRDESLVCEYRRLLDDEERRREQRFRLQADRHRYVVTRALLRTTLSRVAPIAPEDWFFSANQFGKPHVANDVSNISGLSFNISHSENLVVLAVAWNRRVGIDAETIHLHPGTLELARHFFASIEADALSAECSELRHERFVEYWTLKESYIKARGMGLSIPLDHFWFCLDDHKHVRLAVSPELGDAPSRWYFWQVRLSADYIVAVCAETLPSVSSVSQLRFRQVVPLGPEQPIECSLIRASDSTMPREPFHADTGGCPG